MESGGLSEDEKKMLEERKSRVERENISRMQKFQKMKDRLTGLVKKKNELEREVHMMKQYLVRYRKELKEKEKVVMVEIVLSSDKEKEEEEMK